ncbi:MAG TPA: ABC-F family ATP-binding cassette domain-containing protein [Polyangiaceae bacterium]|nr:ABC-F family ATP-binding cassette domain-containing protein [Polyangiaceae bacterium]
MLTLSQVSKSYGPRTLFANASLELRTGVRYGLVGANGSGKTTLLRVLAGDEPPTDGNISYPKEARFGVLRQDRFVEDSQRIVDVAMMGDELVWKALEEIRSLELGASADPERITALDELIRTHEGYALRSRASQVLAGLGIETSVQERNLGTLSGGFKLRVLLAQVLLSRPDILLLDEPTNHLDILSIRWLEKFLAEYRGCAVIISHDRRFLDHVVSRVLDVDYDTITEYVGNYSEHVEQKRAFREQQEAQIAKQEKVVADKMAFIERFRAKATKARQAQSRVKQIERIEIQELGRSSRRYPHFNFVPARQSGKDVLNIEHLAKSYGTQQVLNDVSFMVRRNERVAIIGPNGIGKSTLLKCAVGTLKQDQGDITWGHEARVSYFAQDHAEALGNPERTLLEWLWQFAATQPESWVRGQLGQVLFSGDDVKKKIGALSGGESARLVFARLAIEQPNVLVLDEPTNHLDFEAIEMLVTSLQQFEGTVIVVSHDRWFVSQVATRIIELLPVGYRDFPGTFDEYLGQCGDDHLDADAVLAKAKEQAAVDASPNLELNRQRDELKRKRNRLKALPQRRDAALAEVERLEQRATELEARYAEPGFFDAGNAASVAEVQADQQRTREALDAAIQQWETLEGEILALEQELARAEP